MPRVADACSIKKSDAGRPPTPPSCTTSPAGERATFRSTRTGTCGSIPTKDPDRWLDLKQLVDRLQLRGIDLPILIRFAEHPQAPPGRDPRRLRRRRSPSTTTRATTAASTRSRSTSSGKWSKKCCDFGKPYDFGLEAGSKPELLAVVAMADDDTPIICNGFKDAEFIEMAMLAQKIGRQIIPVVEKYTELELILKYRREGRRAAADRHARQAGRARQRALAAVGRLPLEVRPDRHRDSARAGRTQEPRHGGLLQAAALPPGQPDHQHPPDQRRAERSGARLCRPGQAAAPG